MWCSAARKTRGAYALFKRVLLYFDSRGRLFPANGLLRPASGRGEERGPAVAAAATGLAGAVGARA